LSELIADEESRLQNLQPRSAQDSDLRSTTKYYYFVEQRLLQKFKIPLNFQIQMGENFVSILALMDFFLNSVSFSSVSANFNTSYERRLLAGESLTVLPAGRGAILAADSHLGQKWDIYVNNIFATSFEEDDYAVKFGDHDGHVVITASRDITFTLHIRFVPYEAGEKPVLVHTSSLTVPDPPAQHPPAQSPSASGSAEALVLIVSFLALIAVVVCVIRSRRQRNHEPNDFMEISEDEEVSIPPSLPRPVRGIANSFPQPVQYVYIMPPPAFVPH
jgi:hypothetical protein